MTIFPQIPALHVCAMRGKERVFALMGSMDFPDGVVVPKTFKTDGMSIPRFARSIIGKYGVGFAAAIRHDYDYAIHDDTRKDADIRFLFNLRAEGMGRIKSRLIYTALRQWGWIAWNNNSKRNPEYFFEDLSKLNP